MADSRQPETRPPSAAAAAACLKARLLAALTPAGCWEGLLSGSAVSTATAGFALQQAAGARATAAAARAMTWLCATMHADGGWGDTPDSPCNLTATVLAWAALTSMAGHDPALQGPRDRAAAWLARHVDPSDPASLRRVLQAEYGDDRTFCAPILAMAAMAGGLGEPPAAWDHVPALPFEAAVLPRAVFRWLRVPVVSYGLPALIAVGLVRHRAAARRGAVSLLRSACAARALRVLEKIQPAHGGFLDAAPLTAFVVMSLVHARCAESPVLARGTAFLLRTQRPDGSWPIDTGLPVWITTLAVKALAVAHAFEPAFDAGQREHVMQWLLARQYRHRHPFTGANPGGWSWTAAPGGVPDADDTAGALVALRHLDPGREDVRAAAARGVRWLLDLQNRDGGLPTFCRGFGRLPFDRSGADLTAHALQAMVQWSTVLPPALRTRAQRFQRRALGYLHNVQAADGSWDPLWFGCQEAPRQRNPVFGTAQVLSALKACPASLAPYTQDMRGRAARWLRTAQGSDGGWGGAPGLTSGIEETSLAVRALAGEEEHQDAVRRGLQWLCARIGDGAGLPARPIGLYFARLWYAEACYPYVFALSALAAGSGNRPAPTARRGERADALRPERVRAPAIEVERARP